MPSGINYTSYSYLNVETCLLHKLLQISQKHGNYKQQKIYANHSALKIWLFIVWFKSKNAAKSVENFQAQFIVWLLFFFGGGKYLKKIS